MAVVVQCDYCGKMMAIDSGKYYGYYEIHAYKGGNKRYTSDNCPETIITCDLCNDCFKELTNQMREKRKNAS